MLEQIKEFLAKANDRGLAIPLLRDPKIDQASLSFSLTVVSFLYAAVLIGLNVSGQVENISYAMELFYASAGLYFGKSMTINRKNTTSVQLNKKRKKK